MPHYHLNLKDLDGKSVADDEDGEEFASVEHAFLAAFQAARELWGQLILDRVDPRRLLFEIADARGEVIMTLPFSEILDSCTTVRASPSQSTQSFQERHVPSLRHLAEIAERLANQVALSRSIVGWSRDLRHRSARLASEVRTAAARSTLS